jgi:hypothetical protein
MSRLALAMPFAAAPLLFAFAAPFPATLEDPARPLSFQARVRAQEAIARVYYAHQTGASRPFAEAVPRSHLERKVRDTLRLAAALEKRRPGSLSDENLALEVERMERGSRLPERLREIFAALGNDPVLIREGLARPLLAARLASSGNESGSSEPASRAASVPSCQPGDTWYGLTTSGAPSPRSAHSAVWTGTHMIVWGGAIIGGTVDTGGVYDPATDSWTPTSTVNTPSARFAHEAIWTGTEMIVWGGDSGSSGYLDTGARYNPLTDTWSPMSTTNAPAKRYYATSVWTGSRMIVWGGSDSQGYFDTGGLYDPVSDRWTPTATAAAPAARWFHTAVWTGHEMIVWGGYGYSPNYLNSGGRYDPATDSWRPTSTTDAPSVRSSAVSVWTGSRMVVWGGSLFDGVKENYDNTGGRYDPATDAWSPTSTSGAPSPRVTFGPVWTGREMIVWSGADTSGSFSTGGRYDPESDAWTPLSVTGAPAARNNHTATWTGSAMIVWGGNAPISPTASGGVYVPGATGDADGDGWDACAGDCDDHDAAVHPGAADLCNGRDDDCDGTVDEDTGTIDCGLGVCHRTTQGCQDGNPEICVPGPPSPEICNGLDDDCDGLVDELGAVADRDQDGIADACDACANDPGNDADGDGICGDNDRCPTSDRRPVVIVNGCSTGVPNAADDTGCTLQDLLNVCTSGASNRGRAAACIAQVTAHLRGQLLLSGRQKGQILACTAR